MHTDDVDNKYGTAVRYLYTICIWLSLKLQTSTCIIELCKVLWRCLWWLCTAPLSSGYNYLQLLYREIEEILLYQGFLRPILLTKHPECSEKELIEGTRGTFHRNSLKQGYNARKFNCSCVYSGHIVKPVLSGRNFIDFLSERWIPCQASVLYLRYRPETVHYSTKDAYTSEITFLAL